MTIWRCSPRDSLGGCIGPHNQRSRANRFSLEIGRVLDHIGRSDFGCIIRHQYGIIDCIAGPLGDPGTRLSIDI